MKKFIAILLSMTMLSMAFANVTLVTAEEPVQSSGQDYEQVGDWFINSALTRTGETIWVTGNITIQSGGSLTLVDSTIVMNSSATIRYHIEVQNGGSLTLLDGGDGLRPDDNADTDPSIIQENATGSYNFWINSGATVNVQESIIHGAGNNTDMPPNPWSGVYIRSSAVTIEDSMVTGCGHALIWDSVYPASFARNNITGNGGVGFGMGDLTNPAFDVDYVLTDNIISGNMMHAALFVADVIDVEVYNTNMSENGFGVTCWGGSSVILNVHDNEFWDNIGSTEQDASTVYATADVDDSVLDVTVENNVMAYNDCGSVWVGISYVDDARYGNHTTVLMANNTLIGNDGGSKFQAKNDLTAKVVDNYISYNLRSQWASMDRFRFGYGTDSGTSDKDEFPEFLDLEFSRNYVDMGMYSDYAYGGGLVRTGAKQTMDSNICDNQVYGGYDVGGVFIVG